MPINITGSYKYKKSRKKSHVPLLPGDNVLLKQIEQEQVKRREKSQNVLKLDNLGPTKLQWQQYKHPDNMIELIYSILGRMWSDFPEKGLSQKRIANISDARTHMDPIIMVSHLYGLYVNNNTLVDRTIAACQKQGTVRVFTVNISHINELIMESSKYYELIPDEFAAFRKLLDAQPEATWFSDQDLKQAGLEQQIPDLISRGYLTIDPSKSGFHNISVPRQGAIIKLVLAGRNWIAKTLRSTKWKELPENILQDKLERSSFYWNDLKGLSLEYILYDAVGSGIVEAFNTPIGRGWKLLGV